MTLITLVSSAWFMGVLVQIKRMEKKSVVKLGYIHHQISSTTCITAFWFILTMLGIITNSREMCCLFLVLNAITHSCFVASFVSTLNKEAENNKKRLSLVTPRTTYEALLNVREFMVYKGWKIEETKTLILREDTWSSPSSYSIKFQRGSKYGGGEIEIPIYKEVYEIMNKSLSRLNSVRKNESLYSNYYYFSHTTISDLLNLEYYELDNFIDSL